MKLLKNPATRHGNTGSRFHRYLQGLPVISVLCIGLLSISLDAAPPSGATVRPLPEQLIPAWRQPVPFRLPSASFDDFLQDSQEKESQPSFGVEFDRLIAHRPARIDAELLFPASAKELEIDPLPARVRFAHDGENLLVSIRAGLIPGRTPANGKGNLGLWPLRKAPFDNTECLMIAAAVGNPANVPQRAIFIDWNGVVELRKSNGGGPVAPAPDQNGSDFPKKSVISGNTWTVTASIPFSLIFGQETAPSLFRLNVARLYGAPEKKIAPRAASLAGSFYAYRRFPAFAIESAEEIDDTRLVGIKLGNFPSNGLVPAGRHHAEATLFRSAPGNVTVRHRLLVEPGNEEIVFEKEVELKKGLNQVRWEWATPAEQASYSSIFEVDGLKRDTAKLAAMPRLAIEPSLFVARPGDTVSHHIDLGCTREQAALLQYRLELLRDGKPIHAVDLPGVSESTFDVDLDLSSLPPLEAGHYTVEFKALKDKQVWARAAQTFDYEPSRPSSSSPAKAIDIPLQNASFAANSLPFPVRTGIPFPQGILQDTSALRLVDQDGAAVPFALTAVARWPQSRSVKWAHLDFTHDPSKQYRLISSSAPLPAPETRLMVEERPDDIRVSTGPLTVVFGRKGFDGFRQWTIASSRDNQVHKGLPGSFYVIDEAGIRFDSSNADGRTEIEEANGERVTLKFSGTCAATDLLGQPPSPLRYVMRMTFHRGRSAIDISHSLIITTHTQYHRFRKIGLALGIADRATAMRLASLPPVETGGGVAIRQLSPDRRILFKDSVGKEIDASTRGEFQWQSASALIGLNIRDFREMAPLEVANRPAQGLEIDFWPDLGSYAPVDLDKTPHDLKIRLPFIHQGPLLDFNVPESYLGQSDTDQQHWYLLNGLVMGDAIGLSRTHRFELVFAPADSEELSAQADAWFAHPYVAASPLWMSESGALTSLPLSPANPDSDDPAIARAETALSRAFDWEKRHTVPHTEGKWTWGAMHSAWDSANETFTLYRPFRNSHHRSTRAYYYLFARSGDPKYLELGERATNYIGEIAMPHHTDSDLEKLAYYGKRIGAMCDYKGFVPWNSGSRFDYNTYAENFLNSYYLTGNPLSLEVVNRMRTLALEERRGSSGIGRPGASRMETVGSLYGHFHDGRLLGYLHRSFADIKASQSPQGFIAGGVEFATWLPNYIELTRSRPALDVLKKLAYCDLKEPAWYDFMGKTWQPNWDIQAYAYKQFGDPALLTEATRRFERNALDSIYLRDGDPEDGYMSGYNVTWNFFANQAPAFLWALSKAGTPRWETLNATYIEYRVPQDWTTIAAFQGRPSAPVQFFKSFHLNLRGALGADREVHWRVVAADGAVLEEGRLGPLVLRELPLSNPPIDPKGLLEQINPGRHPAPYFLQLSGDKKFIRLLTPYSDLEKEVYATGGFYRDKNSSGSPEEAAQSRFYCRYGNRSLFFQVPENGNALAVEMPASPGSPYHLKVTAGDGTTITTLSEFPKNGATISLPFELVSEYRGQVIGLEPNVGRAIFLDLGRDFPAWVALSRRSFFVPEIETNKVVLKRR